MVRRVSCDLGTVRGKADGLRSRQGFTLIEMAIVLAVVGLLVGGGLMALGPILDRTRTNQTNTALDQIENALVLFAIRNNRLPCPANGQLPNIAANAATYGIEGTQAAAGTCPYANANSVVPWRTLGLDETYSLDGWGNRIAYFAANTGFNAVSPLVATNCSASPTTATCVYRTSGTNVYPSGSYIPIYSAANTATELTNASTADRAAYVLISHGRSGWYGRNRAGNRIVPPSPTRTLKLDNADGLTINGFVQGTPIGAWPDRGNANYFDDIVRWRSPAFIIQLCGSGACGNP